MEKRNKVIFHSACDFCQTQEWITMKGKLKAAVHAEPESMPENWSFNAFM